MLPEFLNVDLELESNESLDLIAQKFGDKVHLLHNGPLNDIPNLLSIAYVYDLPVGRGRKFLNHGGLADQIIGGWKISGIQSYQGGLPQNVVGPSNLAYLESVGYASEHPDEISGVPMASVVDRSGHFDPAVDSQFNSAAFAIPCSFCF